MIIDQSKDSADPGLAARKIWEVLFRLTDAYKWESLDSFLCDLKIFENEVQRTYAKLDNINTFYWYYDQSGYTYITDKLEKMRLDDGYKIIISRKPWQPWNITIDRIEKKSSRLIF